MPFHVPDTLRESVLAHAPEDAPAWLISLPRRVLLACRRWDLRVQSVVVPGGRRSWVAYVLTPQGTRFVLKLSFPHPDATREAEALRLFGASAVQVIDDAPDLCALLLAQVGEGDALSDTIWAPAQRAACGAEELARLWSAPDRPWPSVQERCACWPAWLAHACGQSAGDRFARLLARPDAPVVLLHGDPHAGNLLRDGETWKWIDPLPMTGPPAADVGRLVASTIAQTSSVDVMQQTIADGAQAGGCPVNEVLLWTAATAVADGQPHVAAQLLQR